MRVVYIIENAYIVISFADRAVGAAWSVMDEMGKLTHFVCFLLCVGGFSPHPLAVSQHTIRGDRALCLALFSCLLLGFTLLFHCSGPSLNDWKKWQSFHLPRPRWPFPPHIFIQPQTHRCTPLPSHPHLCFCLSLVCFCSILPFTSSAKLSSLLKSSPICIHHPFVRFPSSPAGLDSARIRQAGQIAGQSSTRRLGDYRVKFNYNEIDLLRWSWKNTKYACSFFQFVKCKNLERIH